MKGFGVTPIPLPMYWSTSQKQLEQIRRRHQKPHLCQNRRCAANSAGSSPPVKVDSSKQFKRSPRDIGGQKSRSSTVASDGTPTRTKVLERVMAHYVSAIERCADCKLPLEPRKSDLRALRDTPRKEYAAKRVSKCDLNISIPQQSSKVYSCSISIPTRTRRKPSAETHPPLSSRSRNSSILSSTPRRALMPADIGVTRRIPSGIHGPNCQGPSPDCLKSSKHRAVSRCPSVETCASVPSCPFAPNFPSIPSCPSPPRCSPILDFPKQPSRSKISKRFVHVAAEFPSDWEPQSSCYTARTPKRIITVTPGPACFPMEETRNRPNAEDHCTVSLPNKEHRAGTDAQLYKESRAQEEHHWRSVFTERSRCGSSSPSCPVSPRHSNNRLSDVVGPSETPPSRRLLLSSAPRVASRTLPPLERSNSSRRIFVTSGSEPSLSEESYSCKDNDFSSIPREFPQSECAQSRSVAPLPQRTSHRDSSMRQTVSDTTQMCLLEQRIEDEEQRSEDEEQRSEEEEQRSEDEEQRSESSELVTILDDSTGELCEAQRHSALGRVSRSSLANIRRVPIIYSAKKKLALNSSRRCTAKNRKLRVALELGVLIVMVTLLVIVFFPTFNRGFTSYFYGCCSCLADSALATGIEDDTASSQMRPNNNIWVYSGVRNLLKCPLAQQAMGSTVLK